MKKKSNISLLTLLWLKQLVSHIYTDNYAGFNFWNEILLDISNINKKWA